VSRRIERRMKRLEEIRAEFAKSKEGMGLEALDSNALIDMHNADADWLRPPCGDLEIDGWVLVRKQAIGDILQARRVSFTGGKFQGPVLP
jgi:hypothetical protein